MPFQSLTHDAGTVESGAKRKVALNSPDMADASNLSIPTNQILLGDSIKLLGKWPAGKVDLVFADPPFNIGYKYHNYDDRRDVDDYLNFSRQWITAVYRALRPGGSFYLAIGDEFAADLCVIARREIGFTLRNWIVWHYTFGQQTKKMFAKTHTHILYFSKGMEGLTFNADAVRVASARQTTYADARANPKGKLPDDVWFLRPPEATATGHFAESSDTWNVSRVCGTFKEREGWHGCQMPLAVLNRIIRASSNPGDLVVDPFNGSGTTVISAALLGRKYVGIDQSQEYVDWARKRLTETLTRQAAGHATGQDEQSVLRAATDHTRKSRKQTKTDSLGRKRVPRRKARRSA
jgi:DNA modification methylase